MEVSYQHANPRRGNESFLLRFADDGNGVGNPRTPCVLVDAGENVDVDALLDDEDYLAAIVLTHAHSDHYQSLADNLRDGAPIYASEATARILEPVLEEAKHHADGGLGDIAGVLDALEAFDGWESPVAGLRLAPVPAGHTPGACGVLVQFADDADERRTILATGDWTPQRAAGYPGVDTALPVDVGAVFLTAATNDAYEESLTDSVGTIFERVAAGSSVLVSASALTGVRYAYLLGHLGEALERPHQVTLVGQAAKLAVALEYDLPHVETVPDFAEPEDVLTPGTVTIAGPEHPTEGSSGRLFGALRNDPSATLVQICAEGTSPSISAACTTYDFSVIAHPPETALDTVIEDLRPTQVVITHQRERWVDRFKDEYDSYVWTTDDTKPYTLFENGAWTPPEWMTDEGRSYVHHGTGSGRGLWMGDAAETDAEIPLPSCTRNNESVDLDAEGLDLDRLERRLRTSATTDSASVTAETDAAVEPATDPDAEQGTDAASAATSVPDPEREAEIESPAIAARLDAIETQLAQMDGAGQSVPVRMVDAGDGVQLLRVLGEDLDVEHGETLAVTLRRVADADAEAMSGGTAYDPTTDGERNSNSPDDPSSDDEQTELDVAER